MTAGVKSPGIGRPTFRNCASWNRPSCRGSFRRRGRPTVMHLVVVADHAVAGRCQIETVRHVRRSDNRRGQGLGSATCHPREASRYPVRLQRSASGGQIEASRRTFGISPETSPRRVSSACTETRNCLTHADQLQGRGRPAFVGRPPSPRPCQLHPHVRPRPPSRSQPVVFRMRSNPEPHQVIAGLCAERAIPEANTDRVDGPFRMHLLELKTRMTWII